MDSYIYMITALLPLAAAMLVFQVNPYHALACIIHEHLFKSRESLTPKRA